ncbi:methionine synthase [bacterium]|nr:methionine synthase [bacterium]
MRGLGERLAAGEVLIGDGALGTQLIERGMGPGSCPEALSLSHPDWLEAIARAYAAAGADLVVTNTFGASPQKLAAYGLADRLEEIVAAAVAAARRGAGARAAVSGSIGPTGKLLKPYGDTEPAALAAGFARQAAALAAAGVDAFSIETMTDLAEAVLAVAAAREAAPQLPILATMTFDETPRGFFTIMGASVPAAAAGLAAAGAAVVGSNCGNGAAAMVKVAREFVAATRLPVIIQPNAGRPAVVGGKTIYGESPAFMAERARELLDLGVRVVGGCCGTTPEHIRALAETRARWLSARA